MRPACFFAVRAAILTAMRMVLDTCVLFPVATREILLNYAKAGGFDPVWSTRILEEWTRAAETKLTPADAARAAGDIALMKAHFRHAMAEGWEEIEDEVQLPDPSDAHVIAAARTGSAIGVITFNLRDFPMRALTPFGLSRQHPDEFLRNAWLRDGQRLQAAMTPLADAATAHGASFRAFLKRANLPRLGKLWDAEFPPDRS